MYQKSRMGEVKGGEGNSSRFSSLRLRKMIYKCMLLQAVALLSFLIIFHTNWRLVQPEKADLRVRQLSSKEDHLRFEKVGSTARGFLETGSFAYEGQIYSMGGYPCSESEATNIEIMDTRKGFITTRGPALPWPVHHLFNSVFASGQRLVMVGGIRLEGQQSVANHQMIILSLDTMAVSFHQAPVGGMTHCSPEHGGKVYCYVSATDYIKITESFLEIDVSSLAIKQLSLPPATRSHAAIFVDRITNQSLVMCGGRPLIGATETCFRYFLTNDTWIERGWLPLPLEGNALVSTSDGMVYFFGGQDTELNTVTDAIIAWDFKEERGYLIGRAPNAHFGGYAVESGGYVYLIGGSVSVGPHCSSQALRIPLDKLRSATIKAKLNGMQRVQQEPSILILSASYGGYDATEAISEAYLKHGPGLIVPMSDPSAWDATPQLKNKPQSGVVTYIVDGKIVTKRCPAEAGSFCAIVII